MYEAYIKKQSAFLHWEKEVANTEIPTNIDPSATEKYRSATGSMIVGISVGSSDFVMHVRLVCFGLVNTISTFSVLVYTRSMVRTHAIGIHVITCWWFVYNTQTDHSNNGTMEFALNEQSHKPKRCTCVMRSLQHASVKVCYSNF